MGFLVKKAFAELFVILKDCVLSIISGEKGGCLLVLFFYFRFFFFPVLFYEGKKKIVS